MDWKEITHDIPHGEYIVKTKTLFNWHVMRATVHYDKDGKQIWSCKRQTVTHYLN